MAASSQPLVICVTGAECTGKSTLAARLAGNLGMPLVVEAARDYLSDRARYQAADLLAIARAQIALEEQALGHGRPVVADTDLSVIQVWWEEKYGALPPDLLTLLEARSARRYLLMAPDLPWEFDPLRENPHDRPRLHQRYREILEAGPFPWAEISGHGDRRLRSARRQVEAWLAGTGSGSDRREG